jgi:hypothetical protein
MAGIINFVEQQRQVLLYDYLIYVAGVEISAYVKDLTISYQDRNGQGSVDITLTNPFDQWIITVENLEGVWRNTNDRYTETPKKNIWLNKRQYTVQFSLNNNITVASKFTGEARATTIPFSPEFAASELEARTKQDWLERYSFGPGSCIFTKFDTIKVFIKNPYDPAGADRWFPAFTGTVENHPFSTNFVDGDSSVHIMGYDIKSTLQGMRIDVNPYQSKLWETLTPEQRRQNIVFDSNEAGFFKDLFPQQKASTSNVFANKTFVDTVSLITTGATNWVNGNNPVYNGTPPKFEKKGDVNFMTTPGSFGIGLFQPGKVVRYAAEGNQSALNSAGQPFVTDLGDWDDICLFGYDPGMKSSNGFWSESKCNEVGRGSFWNGDHSPLRGYVHFLIPADGLNITNAISNTTQGSSNIVVSPEWTNRHALLSQVCSQLDYEWTISGNGDMIFEFPMYDFYPENFGNNKSLYEVDKHAESEDISDEGGEMISGLEADGVSANFAQQGAQQAVKNIGQAIGAEGAMRQVFVSNTIAAKVGVKVASKTFYGVSELPALYNLAVLEFQKRLADANKLSLNFTYRPFIRPNRPLHHITRERMGKINNVRLNIPSLRAGTISVGLHCVRTPLWMFESPSGKNKVFYQQIFGGPRMSLSYNSVFEVPPGAEQKGDPQMGVTGLVAGAKSNQSGQPGVGP